MRKSQPQSADESGEIIGFSFSVLVGDKQQVVAAMGVRLFGLNKRRACSLLYPLGRVFDNLEGYRSGSILIIAAPRLLPTQNVGGLVELSTFTRRMLVVRGRR
jgi:hypothetical protein